MISPSHIECAGGITVKYECYLTFRSVTAAQRGAYALERFGYVCPMVRSPREIAGNGCGYSLLLPRADARAAAGELDRLGLPHTGLYCARGAGGWEAAT